MGIHGLGWLHGYKVKWSGGKLLKQSADFKRVLTRAKAPVLMGGPERLWKTRFTNLFRKIFGPGGGMRRQSRGRERRGRARRKSLRISRGERIAMGRGRS